MLAVSRGRLNDVLGRTSYMRASDPVQRLCGDCRYADRQSGPDQDGRGNGNQIALHPSRVHDDAYAGWNKQQREMLEKSKRRLFDGALGSLRESKGSEQKQHSNDGPRDRDVPRKGDCLAETLKEEQYCKGLDHERPHWVSATAQHAVVQIRAETPSRVLHRESSSLQQAFVPGLRLTKPVNLDCEGLLTAHEDVAERRRADAIRLLRAGLSGHRAGSRPCPRSAITRRIGGRHCTGICLRYRWGVSSRRFLCMRDARRQSSYESGGKKQVLGHENLLR
ncbi:hypothetical protein BURKHO8Y_20149 [Burkholderia sp. 8Y]|nr:hypothetical protein BURKHO8Y_20149 [Burkholderia sp. 8Y]